MVGWIGLVNGLIDENGVFEVRFYHHNWTWLPVHLRYDAVYANDQMVEFAKTGIEKELGL
jgi:hypothetical protein